MTEEEKKRLREALAAAKNAGSWKVPTGTSKPKVATVGGIDEGSEHNRGSVSDLRKNYASQPKAAETKVATVGGISEGSDYNRGSISELRKNAPSAAKSKVAAVGDSAFAGVTGFNRGLTGILGAAADLVDPMYKFIEEQSFYQGAPAWSQKAIDLVTGRMAQQNLKKTADYYKKSDEEAQAQVQNNIEAGQMGEIGNALIQGTVQAVPNVAAAWMGAGIPAASQSLAGTVNGAKTTAQMMGSAVKEMASKPQFILSAAQSFGGAYDEALAKGADTGEAITAAVLTAFPEAMIDSMGGTEKLVEKIAGEAGRKGVKGAIQDILQNMAEEGLEELVQYPVGKMAAMGYDPDMKLYSTTEEAVINPVEMGKAAAMGAAIGGIMGGGAKVGDVVVSAVGRSKGFEAAADSGQTAAGSGSEKKYGSTVPENGVVNDIFHGVRTDNQTIQEKKKSAKAAEHQKKYSRYFVDEIRKLMSVPNTDAARAALDPVASEAVAEIRESGRVSDETAERLFETAFEQGRIVDEEFYQTYKGLRDSVRKTRLQLSEKDRSDIPDYADWRRRQFGKLNIVSSDGVPVDVAYQQWAQDYPELFPDNITHPAEQLRQIAEVMNSIRRVEYDLGSYYGEDADMFRRDARDSFEQALAKLIDGTKYVQRYEADLQRPEVEEAPAEAVLGQAWKDLDEAREAAQTVRKKYLLTDNDRIQVKRLARGEITEDQIADGTAKAAILETARAERAVAEAEEPIQRYNTLRHGQLEGEMARMLDGSEGWQDKRAGLLYARETMERNIRDITGGSEAGEQLISRVFTPIHQNEAGRQRMKNMYGDQVRALRLSKKESAWVQMVGEGEIELETLPQDSQEKVRKGVELLRDRIYPELLEQVNRVLLKNGYRPVQGRKNYFPHFQDSTDPLVVAFKKLGMEIQTDDLPTAINGLTHTFKPGKQWVGNFLRRVGEKTEYDALRGFDRYIEGVSNVVWHTDDIQNLRALESALRHKYSEEGQQERIEAVRTDGTLTEEQRDEKLAELFAEDLSHMGGFAAELRSYTDSMAGKKSLGDRETERKLSRTFYSIAKAMESRVAANMVALNPGSWLTNFIPITQATAEVNPKYLLQAMTDTMKAKRSDDGFASQSAFLVNRKGSDKVGKTKLDSFVDRLAEPMQAIDDFTSQTITRAFYAQNIDRGMDPDSAMTDADQRAAGLMADRSKGALPTIFEEKNPLTKMFTMFQTEVNNQLSWMFKDLPREAKKNGGKAIAAMVMNLALTSWAYNELYEKLVGRRPAFDVVGMAMDVVETTKEKGIAAGLGEGVKQLGGQLPFVSSFVEEGGRLPVSAAIPKMGDLWKGVEGLTTGEMAPNAALQKIGKELVKPVGYLVTPVGYSQIKKTAEGVGAWLEGGSYTTRSDGSREMQYPIEQNAWNLAKAAVFGKSAFEEAQEYYDGYKKTTDFAEKSKLEELLGQWFPDVMGSNSERDTVAENMIRKDTPRIVEWNVTDENGVKTGRRVELSRKEQKQYQAYYAEYLAEGVGSLAEDQQQKLREYAREMSTRRILGDVGEEYEVKEWVAEAAQAEEAGVGIKTYIGLQEIFAGIEPDKDEDGKTLVTSTEKKRAALMEREDLTAEQKNLIDRLLIQSGDNIKEVDYSSAASLQYTTLDSAERARVDSIRTAFPGMSVDSVDKYRGICESGFKREKLSALQNEGMSEADAVLFYRLNGTAADKVDLSSREAAIRSTMSADEKVRASAAAYAVKGITEEQYLVYTALLDGTKEENKAALVKKGLSESQAEKLLRVAELKETDDVKSWNDVVYATMSDSQRTKLSQLQEYYPKATAADFDVCYQIYQSTKADKNAAGKTISGSKKKKVIAKLMEKGLGYNAALTFYNLMS